MKIVLALTLMFSTSASHISVDKLWSDLVAISSTRKTVQAKATLIGAQYEARAPINSEAIRASADKDLHMLFKIVDISSFYAQSGDYERRGRYLGDMRSIIEVLDQRKIIEPQEIDTYYEALIVSRKFEWAAEFKRAHKNSLLQAVPDILPADHLDVRGAAAFTLSKSGRALDLKNVHFPKGSYVVVVADCHKARDAAVQIAKNNRLVPAFKKDRAVWVASARVSLDLAAMKEWDKAFPDFPLHIAYDNAAWKGIDFSMSPNFFFFKDGRLVETRLGWSSKLSEEELAKSLARIGAL